MPAILTVRTKPSKLAQISARASELGFPDRSKYVLALVDRDLSATRPARRRFASKNLIGAYATRHGPATNANTRALLARQLKQRRETNR